MTMYVCAAGCGFLLERLKCVLQLLVSSLHIRYELVLKDNVRVGCWPWIPS